MVGRSSVLTAVGQGLRLRNALVQRSCTYSYLLHGDIESIEIVSGNGCVGYQPE